MRYTVVVFATAAALGLGSCTNMSDTGQRTLSGAAVGAAGGAALGVLTSAGVGEAALIGTGLGAAGGFLFDQYQKSQVKQ
jgi:hypothetical protein